MGAAAAARVFRGVNEEEQQLLIHTRPLGFNPPPRRCYVSIYGFCSATVSEDRLLRGPGRRFKVFFIGSDP